MEAQEVLGALLSKQIEGIDFVNVKNLQLEDRLMKIRIYPFF